MFEESVAPSTNISAFNNSDQDTQSEDIEMSAQGQETATRGNLRSTWEAYRDLCEEKIA